jgi:hypothetical protein
VLLAVGGHIFDVTPAKTFYGRNGGDSLILFNLAQ